MTPSLRRQRHAWLFLAVSACALLLAWFIAWLQFEDFRKTLWQGAEQRVQALAQSHAGLAALTLTLADEELQLLRRAYRDNGLKAFHHEASRLSSEGVGGPINRVALLDRNGITLANYLQGKNIGMGANLSDRPYFQALIRGEKDRLFVTEPMFARITGQWIILFARPLLRDGRFEGLVFVGFEAERLGFLFDSVADSELITILSPESRIAARSRGIATHSGALVPLLPDSGKRPFLLTSPADGVTRLSTVRQIDGWGGMRVVAGIEVASLDAKIAAYRQRTFLPALLLTLTLIPATLLIQLGARRQRAIEIALDHEIGRSRKVFERMREGILLLDASMTVTFSNGAARRWLPTADGKDFAQIVHEADFSVVAENGTPLVEDPLRTACLDAGHDLPGAWLRRDADDIWLALSAQILRRDSQPTELLVTLVDRSDERERLTESALNEGILAAMHDAIMVTDARGRIIKVNAAFTLLTGYESAEIVGRTPATLRSGRHDNSFYAEMWNALIREGHWSGRLWNRHKGGEVHCVWHSISAVRNPYGETARYISVSRDITHQAAQESELWQRANFDPLTGLANRSHFADRLAQARANAQRHGHGFALLMLDLDRFKPVNDTLGHAAGDILLRQVAQRIAATLREADTLARIGGDEFALLLPRLAALGDASVVASKIVEIVRTPFDLHEGTVSIGISIGIALFPEHAANDDALIEAADRALYKAKVCGRNGWQFAEVSAHDTTTAADAENRPC